MPQLPDDTPSVFHDGRLGHSTTDRRYAFDDTGYVLLDNGGILASTFDVNPPSSFDTESLHEGASYASHGNESTPSRMAANNAPTNMSDSWEMEIDSNNSIQGSCSEETIPQIDPFSVSMTDSSVIWGDYVIVTDRAQPIVALSQLGDTTVADSDPAIRQNSAECSWGQLSDGDQYEFTGLSSSTASGCPNRQSSEAPGGFWTPDHLFSAFQDRELGSPWESIGPHSVQRKKPSTTDPLGIPEPQDSHEVSHSPARAGAWRAEDFSWQHWPQGSTRIQQHTSQPLFTNPQTSTMNIAAYEDHPLHNRFGLGLARTSSPENTELIYRENSSSAEINMLVMNTIIPTHGSTQCHHLRGSEDMRPIATKPFKSRSSPLQRSNRSSRVTTNGAQKKQSTRILPEPSLENYRKQRLKGVCVGCKCSKKSCWEEATSLFCKNCREIINGQIHLAPMICYRRNFEQVFSVNSDYYDLAQRGNSIKSEIESMRGEERYLFLGAGLREYENKISIDIDYSSVLCVKIQTTTTTEKQHWISTQPPCLTVSMAAPRDDAEQAPYAIVPGCLPEIGALDRWGRQDIRDLARRWPSNLEVSYDLTLLKYLEVRPPLPCHGIVFATMRIVSLGKNLDSRRPIDHTKIVEVITKQQPTFPQFGIDEFNECKAYFQLPMTARTQLHIHAAQAIEMTQLELVKEIDKLLPHKELKMKDNFLAVSACLRRLGLEYRQRLQRYRCFPSDEVEDRIRRCHEMYVLFTRLYEVWCHGTALFSEGTVVQYSEGLRYNKDLVDSFSRLCHLERENCEAIRADSNVDDSIYRKLIACKVYKGDGKNPKSSRVSRRSTA